MLISPSLFCFFLVMILGIVFSVSSVHWLGIWLGMEINLFGILPIIMGRRQSSEIEATIKYYFIQALGSSVLMVGLVMNNFLFGSEMFGSMFLLSGLFIKLGVVPFYFWVPSVMNSVSWFCCFLLSTFQKLGPLFLTMSILEMESVMIVIGCLSSVVGGVGGFNQSQLRALLAYSSIGHSGWMLGGLVVSVGGAFVYFISYFFTCAIVFFVLSMISLFNHNQITKCLAAESSSVFYLLSIGFLSMSGLPPFVMFFGKVIVVFSFNKFLVSTWVYLLGAVVSMYFYLNAVFLWSSSGSMVFFGSHSSRSLVNNILFGTILVSGFPLMIFFIYSMISF
uniref:NADH-ubiquinone oxidoreductase chain 2 n=1 Tax=Cuspidaria undata TaxID=2952366 RepID=A0AAT9T594_9BIVA|nr:NADH dehydrogenase subunit 2 [Cuspidaria undata]USF19205.1 NADH dehydrogenase subunit 2 [Cuspidaria undata]